MTDSIKITHPFQFVLSNSDGTLIFAVIKNIVQVFKTNSELNKFQKIGQWKDEFDTKEPLKEKVVAEQKRQIEENEKSGTTSAKKLKSNLKEAKVPTPGVGAPPIFSYIRDLVLSNDESKLIICTDSDKAAVVFNIDMTNKDNCLTLFKRTPFPKRPSAIITSDDDTQLFLADKFGDVYKMDIQDSNSNEPLEPILGHVSMLTDIGFVKDQSNGQKFLISCDRDEHIKISHYPQTYIVDKWLFGHKEFISSIVTPKWNNKLLISAGGDPYIFSWNWQTGELLNKFEYLSLIEKDVNLKYHLAMERYQNEAKDLVEFCVSKIVTFPELPLFAFFVEATKKIFILNIDQETGKLSLAQTIQLDSIIVSLATNNQNDLIASLDTVDNPQCSSEFVFFAHDKSSKSAPFVKNENKTENFHNFIKEELGTNDDFIVKNIAKDVYPLYNNSYLRKHGEHFS